MQVVMKNFRFNVMLIKKSFLCNNATNKPLDRHQLKELREFLGSILEISPPEVTKLFQKNKLLRKVKDSQDISNVVYKLQKLGIEREQLIEHPQALTAIPVTLENRGMLLQECGFQRVSLKFILRYLNIMKKKISILKSYKEIAPETDVRTSLCSYLAPMPADICMSSEVNKHQSVNDVYMSVLEKYLTWRLNITNPEEYAYILKTHYRIRHKSFRLINETLDILENELHFSKERIRNNAYLIHSHPENTRTILKKFKTIGDLPIETILYKHPKIVMTNVETMEKIVTILKDYKVSNEAIRKSFGIFTLSAELVKKRLEENKLIPEFNVLFDNTRSLRLVQYQCKAKSRLFHLQKLKMKNASLHLLSSTDAQFEKYIAEGSDRTRGNDLLNYLGEKLRVSQGTLRSLLLKHPFWFHVPLVQVSDTVTYLLKKFKTDEILPAIQIVLYPKETIIEELSTIRKKPELNRMWLSQSQILNLCLYYIEVQHHFSGDGIWCHENENTNESLVAL